jgi:hypothetical protein
MIWAEDELSYVFEICINDASSQTAKMICIPASVVNFDNFSLCDDDFTVISIEAGSRFVVSGKFIMTSTGSSLVRYPGSAGEITVVSPVESIARSCFFRNGSLEDVVFEPGSQLREIGNLAFSLCCSLNQICIPASVEILQRECFHRCASLCIVTFESGSKLSLIEEGAFCSYPALKSICIPAPVGVISKFCFDWCFGLTLVELEPESQLMRIESFALTCCRSLRLLCIPASVSSIDISAFFQARAERLVVDDCNTHFSAADGFLLDFAGIRILRFLGPALQIIVGSKIEILSTGSFAGFDLEHRSLTFANGSELREIEEGAFDDYSYLDSISLPRSIRQLSRNWASSKSFDKLVFECGKSLQTILKEHPESMNGAWKFYIRSQDANLPFGGYTVSHTGDLPGFVQLVKD